MPDATTIDPDLEIVNYCGPRIYTLDSAHPLTAGDIRPMTPADIERLRNTDLAGYQIYLSRMKNIMAGAREDTFYDLLMGSAKNVSDFRKLSPRSVKGSNELLPYFQIMREDNVNANAFEIVSGTASEDADMLEIHAGAWELTVGISPSELSSPIQNLETFFLVGETVIAFGVNTDGSAFTTVLSIIGSENADTEDAKLAKITVAPITTAAAWTAMTDDQKAAYHPTSGVAQIGVNRVSDYESWSGTQPKTMSKRLATFWFQTSRFKFEVTDVEQHALEEVIANRMGNPYLAKFQELPLVEKRRKEYAEFQKKMINSFLYGVPAPGQDESTFYDTLEKDYDPDWHEFVGYKSTASGVKTQLASCGRVIDCKGAALDMDYIVNQLLSLKRLREGAMDNGSEVDEIEVWVPFTVYNQLFTLFADYFKNLYGSFQQQLQNGQRLELSERRGFDYMTVDLRGLAQVKLKVVYVRALDDFRRHFPAAHATAGNLMLFLDWGKDVYLGYAAENGSKRTSPHPENDANHLYRISSNIKHVENESITWTAVVERPECSLWVENFTTAECPKLSQSGCKTTETAVS